MPTIGFNTFNYSTSTELIMDATNYLGLLQEFYPHLLLCSISVCLIFIYLFNIKFRSNRGNLLTRLPPGPAGLPLIGSIGYSKYGVPFYSTFVYMSDLIIKYS